ncbi:MAG: SurA N-terminal domain-containing protein [Verrucomicrobiota bacterium]
MISWIQHHLIRHGRWIFLTLLTVIIVAFVFTIGNSPGCTVDKSGYEENLFYGFDLNSSLEAEALSQKVSLSAMLNNQQFRSNEQFQGQLTSRIAMLHLADEIGVPTPAQETLAEYIKTKNAFSGPDGSFSPDAYTRFVDQMESNPGTPQGLVINVLEEDFRIEQVVQALSGPGYLLPSETSAQAQRNRTKLSLAVAELPYNEFEPELTEDPAALTAYYETNKQRYEIPERIKASYVLFASDNYSEQSAEATEAELREHFVANRASFVAAYEAANPIPQAVEGEEAPEPEPVTFEKVQDAVATSLADEKAVRAANEAAQAFAYQLYRDEIANDSERFNQLLKDSSLSLTEIEPFTAADAETLPPSPEMLQSAFGLSENRYFSDAYEVGRGYAVLIYTGRIAPEIPAYEAVAEEVAADFAADEKRRLFSEKGETIKAELEAAVGADTAFVEAAEALNLTTRTFEDFEVRNAPVELNRSALQQAQSMSAGDVSPMLTLGGIGTLVYVESKETPEIAEDDPDLAQSRGMLERWASFTTRTDLTNELVFRGLSEKPDEELE